MDFLKRSYWGFFLRKLRSPAYLIANWRDISSDCVLAEHVFEAFFMKLLAEDPDAVFVQVGANSGSGIHDPSALLVQLEVSSLLIEPQPGPFASLQNKYREYPHIHLANEALSPEVCVRKLYRLSALANEFHAGGNVFGDGIASFSKEHVLTYFMNNATADGKKQDVSAILESIDVDCRPYEEVIAKYGLTRTDILMVDTEGFDYEILKMVFHSGFRPRLIRYEYKHLGKDAVKAWELLRSCSYKQIIDRKNGDTIAVRF